MTTKPQQAFDERVRLWLSPILMTITTFFIVQVYFKMEDMEKNMQLLLIKEAASNQRLERLEEDVKKLERRADKIQGEVDQLYRLTPGD